MNRDFAYYLEWFIWNILEDFVRLHDAKIDSSARHELLYRRIVSGGLPPEWHKRSIDASYCNCHALWEAQIQLSDDFDFYYRPSGVRFVPTSFVNACNFGTFAIDIVDVFSKADKDMVRQRDFFIHCDHRLWHPNSISQ